MPLTMLLLEQIAKRDFDLNQKVDRLMALADDMMTELANLKTKVDHLISVMQTAASNPGGLTQAQAQAALDAVKAMEAEVDAAAPPPAPTVAGGAG